MKDDSETKNGSDHARLRPKTRRAGDLWSMPAGGERDAGKPLPQKSRLCLGIDLGTTSSCVALQQAGRPSILRSRAGTPLIASVLGREEDGHFVVGDAALRHRAVNPSQVIVAAKRLIGLKFHDPIV